MVIGNLKFKFPALAVLMNLGRQAAIFPVPTISLEWHPLKKPKFPIYEGMSVN